LLNRHVNVARDELRFQFKGKGGKLWRLRIYDRRIAKIIKSCQELPVQQLFQYLDENGERRQVTSHGVNAYLKEITGAGIAAKDFRTWTGTVLTAMALSELEKAGSKVRAKRNITRAVEQVAARLGNTAAICRKCYIHPEIVSAYLDGGLLLNIQQDIDRQLCDGVQDLRPEEAAVLAFLRSRIARDLAATPNPGTTAGESGKRQREPRGQRKPAKRDGRIKRAA
jgi:DNA topoisomerase-1